MGLKLGGEGFKKNRPASNSPVPYDSHCAARVAVRNGRLKLLDAFDGQCPGAFVWSAWAVNQMLQSEATPLPIILHFESAAKAHPPERFTFASKKVRPWAEARASYFESLPPCQDQVEPGALQNQDSFAFACHAIYKLYIRCTADANGCGTRGIGDTTVERKRQHLNDYCVTPARRRGV